MKNKKILFSFIVFILVVTLGVGFKIFFSKSSRPKHYYSESSNENSFLFSDVKEIDRKTGSGVFFNKRLPKCLEFSFYFYEQLDAILRELNFPFSWFPKDKSMLIQSSRRRLAELNELRKDFYKVKFEPEYKEIYEQIKTLISGYQKAIYNCQWKNTKEIEKEFSKLTEKKKHLEFLLGMAVIPCNETTLKSFFVISEETKFFNDDLLIKDYIKAIKLYDEYKFSEAYDLLKKLLRKNLTKPAQSIVRIRIADCIIDNYNFEVGEKDVIQTKKLKEAIMDMEKVLKSGVYFPGIYDAFLKWRAIYQYFYYGSSNYNKIANFYYNKIRWMVINTVGSYMEKNPDYMPAKFDYYLLLKIYNISRGYFGNDVTWDFYFYYKRKLQKKISEMIKAKENVNSNSTK